MNDSTTPRCPRCFAATGSGAVCPHCGETGSQESLLALAPGTLLAAQFRIGRVLGSGGFGITYLALDERLEKRVAIKEFFPRSLAHRGVDGATLMPDTGSDRAAFASGLDGFLGEARTLARFDHPNVVRVRTFFEANGTGYLVMDYYEGDTLSAYLEGRPGGKLPENLAVRILMPVLDGLRAVHSAGLLHRDIKPGNIYLTGDGRVLLLDFGAARQAIGEKSQSMSEIYTDGYAPIEQYSRRGDQGPWTDVYACAATLYRMVTGVVPPDAPGRAIGEPLRSARELEPAVSERLSRALQSGLAPRPEERPRSAEAFQQMLAPTRVHQPLPQPSDLEPGHSTRIPGGRVLRRPSWRLDRRTWLVAGLASVFLVGGALAALAGARDNPPPRNPDMDSLVVVLEDSLTGPVDSPPLPPDTVSQQPEAPPWKEPEQSNQTTEDPPPDSVDPPPPDSVDPPPPPPPPPPTAEAEIRAGVNRCLDALRSNDAGRMESLYVVSTLDDGRNKERLLKLMRRGEAQLTVTGSSVSAPQVRDDWAASEFRVGLTWRSSFGPHREEPVTFRAEFAPGGGEWRLTTCRIVGSPNLG